MKNLLNKYFLLPAMLFSLKSFSQEIPAGFEITELVKISEAYRITTDISYDMTFTYADSARQDTVLEQLQGNYKIHNGKYWGILDSIEYLQSSLYSMVIYHADSTILVNSRQEYAPVLQIPLMDSIFREANVARMEVSGLNDSTRSLRVIFNPGSYYHSYELQYDLNTFLLRQLKYYLPELDTNDFPGSSGIVCITINFSNYSGQAISDTFFNESRFVYEQGGQLLAQPSFTGYQVIVSNNTKVQ